MSKALLYSHAIREEQDLHKEMLEGVSQIALAVASTLGPRGSNVIIDRAGDVPQVTKDGVTVARNIQLTNPVHNAAVKMIQAVAKAHELETGDGTTTATVLAHRIFEGGLKLVDEGGESPVGLQRAIGAAVDAVVAQIGRLARIATDEQIAQVATIATNGDSRFGELISQAIRKVGREGTVTLDDSDRPETWLEIREGFQMNSGFLWPDFITDRARGTAVLENPYILISERQLSQGIGPNPTLHDIGPLMTFCAGLNLRGNVREREPRPLLIVADDVLQGSDCAQALLLNHGNWDKSRRGIPVQGGGLQVCAVRAAGFGEHRRAGLADLALATGGRVLTQDGGEALSQWVYDKRNNWSDANLGQCKRAVISNSRLILEGPAGDTKDPGLLPHFADSLRRQAEEQKEPAIREHLLQRAARLTGAVAVLHVGAPTEEAAKALRDLAEDAVLAVRAALAEGIVPGGGLTLFLLAEQLANTADDLPIEAQAGARLLAEAMRWPMRQIAVNAGAVSVWVMGEVLKRNSQTALTGGLVGFNAATGCFDNLIAAGIVDPAKVVRVALEKASSIAALMLTTSCLVYFDPEANARQTVVQLPPMPQTVAGRS